MIKEKIEQVEEKPELRMVYKFRISIYFQFKKENPKW